MSPFPASRPFIDLALKFRKTSLNPEHFSCIDPHTKTVLPVLRPSTCTQLCNPEISMSHLSKNVYILLIRYISAFKMQCLAVVYKVVSVIVLCP